MGYNEKRLDLIEGTIVDIIPAPSRLHQEILMSWGDSFNYLLDKTCKVYVAPFDVRLPWQDESTEENKPTGAQPDLVVVMTSVKSWDQRVC